MAIWQNMQSNWHSARRMAKTTHVLQKQAWRWLKDREPVPELAVTACEELGTTYIKLGQLVASSPSLFPHEYVEAFQRCLDQTTPIPFSEVSEIIDQQLGSLRHRFKRIDTVPLASASIAQVHAAELVTGEPVVLKVQKPGVKELVETDFRFMQLASSLVERFNPAVPPESLSDLVDELHRGMIEECDFKQEAENIRAYQEFLDNAGITSVIVPKVYADLSTEKVLVMERFFGASLANQEAIDKYLENPEESLIGALNTWFASLFQCQIYHADLHAGNVMVLQDGRIGFIDFGIVGKISESTWNALMSLSVSLPAGDFTAIAQALITMGATNKKVDEDALANDLKKLVDTLEHDVGLETDDLMRGLTIQLSNIGRQHGIRFPREFTLLVKQLLYFDRYIRLLAPELDMIHDDRVIIPGEYSIE